MPVALGAGLRCARRRSWAMLPNRLRARVALCDVASSCPEQSQEYSAATIDCAGVWALLTVAAGATRFGAAPRDLKPSWRVASDRQER
jgi:hypothetical protein